jgi:hypothetical protein
MPRPRRWKVPANLLVNAKNRALSNDLRPSDVDRAYLREALGRRKSRVAAKAIRAAGLYMISREVAPPPEQQVLLRCQDARAHDWRKAYETPGIPPYGAMADTVKDNVSDVQDVMP